MGNKKTFSIIILSAILIILLIFFGLFLKSHIQDTNNLNNNIDIINNENFENENREIQQKSTENFLDKTEIKQKKDILVYINRNLKEQLTEELNIYKIDVERELPVRVIIREGFWNSKEKIKQDITSFEENLMGILLIGDLPTAKFSQLNIDYTINNDYYYVDLEEHCEYDYKKSAYDSDSCQLAFSRLYSKYWIGRLTPPTQDFDMQVQMLKDYFKRNHEYRTGKLNTNNKLLLSYTDYDYLKREYDVDMAESSLRSYTNTITYFDYLGLWKDNEIDILIFNSDAIGLNEEKGSNEKFIQDAKKYDYNFLKKLQEPYQFSIINVHGSPKSHDFFITKEDYIKYPPKTKFIELKGCSVGNFVEEDYLAGWMLFSGETLAIFTNTDIAVESNSVDSETFFMLKQGFPIGNYLLNEWTHYKVLLGDPTLRIDYNLPNNNAKIKIHTDFLDFGEIKARIIEYDSLNRDLTFENPPEINFIIENIGTDPLVYIPSLRINTDGGINFGGDCIYNHCVLEPGEKHIRTIGFSKTSSFPKNKKLNQLIDAELQIFSNDLLNPISKIKVIGKIDIIN